MKFKSDFPNLTDEEIDEEIKIRQELLQLMVGNLYPQILLDEIALLRELKNDPLRGVRAKVQK